jgi:DNA-binding NtrC family response regulator
LRNIVERAAIVAEGKEIGLSDLPGDLSARADTLAPSDSVNSADLAIPFTADFREDRREFERRYISRCLEETSGNVTKAALLLGMHRQSLQHKLRELGLGRRYVSLESD